MKRILLILSFVCAFAALHTRAQVVTSQPEILQTASDDVTIFFHADRGDCGLMGQPSTAALYAHTGCIVEGKPGDWLGAPSWNSNLAKFKLEYVSENLWKLHIGRIADFYGLSAGEVPVKLAFVFRNSDGSKTGRGAGGADIFEDVYGSGLQVMLTSTANAGIVKPGATLVTFRAVTTSAANISISLDDTQIASTASATELSADYDFTTPGAYTVTAVASSGSDTRTATLSISYPSPSVAKNYPGGIPKMGPVKTADGKVIFCLAAPQKESAVILGDWNNYTADESACMYYQDYQDVRYFWTEVSGINDGKMHPYYFLVDGTNGVGDPYARLVLDPSYDKYIDPAVFPGLPEYPSDKVANVCLAIWQDGINDYNWKASGFKGVNPSDLIIYELLFRDFTGSEGKADGNGTVRQAIEKLDYIKDLGINAIELLPINEFNGNISWGYNPNFYFAPDKAYGTPADYKEFIDEAHARGMAVILDVVFNQTDWQHPWYQLYAPGSNPFYNADAPHAYSVLNDWRQEYPLVQQQFEDCLQYWLKEYKVDGFRFDLVKGLGNNDSYSNSGDAATNAYNASRVARMRKLQEAVLAVKPNAYFINENLAGAQEENEMAAYGQLNWANLNHAGCQYAAGMSAESGLNRFYAPDDQRTWGSTVSYLESHDEQRLAYVQNNSGATGVRGNLTISMRRLSSAAAQMLLSPGAHMIWQFSELGNYQSTKNSDGGNNTDPKTVNWSLFNNAERHGLYDSYAELAGLRSKNPELFAKDATFTITAAAADWDAGRHIYAAAGSKELHCVINPMVDKELTMRINFASSEQDHYYIVTKSYNTEPSFDAGAGTVTVPAGGYAVVASKDVAGVKTIAAENADYEPVYGLRGEIEAPAGSIVFDLAGRRHATTGLQPGLYIVRTPTRTVKVIVR